MHDDFIWLCDFPQPFMFFKLLTPKTPYHNYTYPFAVERQSGYITFEGVMVFMLPNKPSLATSSFIYLFLL